MTDVYQARIEGITEEKEIQILNLIMANGEKITIENGDQPLANVIKYKVNEKVMVSQAIDLKGESSYIIVDYVRKDGLLLLLVVFLGLTIAVTRWRGFGSILGMIFTFATLFMFVLPRISNGSNPVLVASVASLLIIPVSFYLSHGLNKKTTVAIVGSIIALVITCILGYVFINLCYLTGLSSEEAGMLSINQGGLLNMKGLLLAGLLIGALGVLDDITVSQAAIVSELVATAKLVKIKEIYDSAMNIGKDHITSMVNTLVLAYAGAALPLLLIFIDSPRPFMEVINYEMIAEEIVRTLVGSIGLVIAVPITTAIAAYVYKKKI